jgi:hypothetical protein
MDLVFNLSGSDFCKLVFTAVRGPLLRAADGARSGKCRIAHHAHFPRGLMAQGGSRILCESDEFSYRFIDLTALGG